MHEEQPTKLSQRQLLVVDMDGDLPLGAAVVDDAAEHVAARSPLDLARPSNGAPAKPIAPELLSDGDLISAIPDATLGEASTMAGEVSKRRLSAAVPVLTSLCNRFVGYGAGVAVPEQIAAFNALGAIGGQEAKHAVSRLIVKKIVQGPTLVTALTVASQLDVVLPSDVSLNLLRDPTSSVRAAACGCVRSGYEVITTLVSDR